MLGPVLRRMLVLLLDDLQLAGVMDGFRDKRMGRIGLAFFEEIPVFVSFCFTSFIKLL